MTKFYSVAEVVKLMGWDVGNHKKKEYQRGYQRVREAVALGHAGAVSRTDRNFILTRANVNRVVRYLRLRWPEDFPKEENLVLDEKIDGGTL